MRKNHPFPTQVETLALLHTVQCDLCVDCRVAWASGALFDAAAPEGPRVYSAACRRLTVDAHAADADVELPPPSW